MKIISFAETTPALLAGRKTCTRRAWKPSWAARFRAGDLVQAYDRSPRAGGKPVAVIQLTADPYQQETLPSSDWEAEGFEYLSERGILLFGGKTPEGVWGDWRYGGAAHLYVVRFKLFKLWGVVK